MTIETITVTNNKNKILGQAVISNYNLPGVVISQSTLIANGEYGMSYEGVKTMIEKYSKNKYGDEIKIEYDPTQ